MPTTPRGIWSPSDSDDWDLTVDWAAQSVSIDDAITDAVGEAVAAVPRDYRIGTDTARLALTGGDLYEGLRFRTTDTDRDWLYSGSAWLASDPGLYTVYPTSVSGGTIGADGSVSFSGASSISLNGIFSARFREYDIRWTITSRTVTGGTGVELLRLRAGGVDNSAAVYGWRRFVSSGLSILGAVNGTDTSFSSMASSGFTYSTKSIRVVGAFQANYTHIYNGNGIESDTVGSFEQIVSYNGEHRSSTSFDGFSIVAPAGAYTGSVRVYGLV